MEIFDQIRSDIGARLKEERERLRLTQAELAEAIGVGRYTVVKYESGASSPVADHLNRLDQLGADIYYIATGKRAKTSIQQRTDFYRLFCTLQRISAEMNIRAKPEELVRATWVLLDAIRFEEVELREAKDQAGVLQTVLRHVLAQETNE